MKTPELKEVVTSKKFLAAILIIVIVALLFRDVIIAVLLVSATVLLSFIASELKLKYAGIELVTFTVILLSIAYGPVIGIIVGVSLEAVHLLLSRRGFELYTLWVIPSFGVVGFLAGTFATINLLILGIGLTLFLHAIHVIISFFITGPQKMKYSIYAVSNIILNVLLFANFGVFVLHLL